MSNLLADLKSALESAGYALDDVASCICRVQHGGAEPPWNARVRLVKPECFFKAAERVEYNPAGGDEENHIWVVDPLACAIMKDGARFYWSVRDGIEQWIKRPDPHIGGRSPAADVPAESIFLKRI